jgi:hypothetical protein
MIPSPTSHHPFRPVPASQLVSGFKPPPCEGALLEAAAALLASLRPGDRLHAWVREYGAWTTTHWDCVAARPNRLCLRGAGWEEGSDRELHGWAQQILLVQQAVNVSVTRSKP